MARARTKTVGEIREWIADFLTRHQDRHDCHDWPNDADGVRSFTEMWVAQFDAEHVTEDEADAASVALGAKPPSYKGEHLARLLEEVKRARQRAGVLSGSYDEAKASSFGCQRCGGTGLTTVYHPDPYPRAGIAETYGAHCVCALGRWMRAKLRPDLAASIVDLDAVLKGKTAIRWSTEQPEGFSTAEWRERLHGPPTHVRDPHTRRWVKNPAALQTSEAEVPSR